VETSLVPLPDGTLTPHSIRSIRRDSRSLEPAEAERLKALLEESTSPAARRAYTSDWAEFSTWCDELQLASLPADPATVARYVALLAERGLKVATIRRRVTAISMAHQARELEPPTKTLIVRKVLAVLRRCQGVAQDAKAPVLPDDLKAMLGHLDDSLRGKRDRALLLLGFAGAFRRSELVALELADLQVRREGLAVTIRRSKTDQEGEGAQLGIPRGRNKKLCPVRAVEAWIAAAALVEGPLFRPISRHGQVKDKALADVEVWRLVKRLAEACGYDPANYGGHSLRAGLATAAAQAGAEERDSMRQTRHRSERMVRKYIRGAKLFDSNADGLL
jgi:integrase